MSVLPQVAFAFSAGAVTFLAPCAYPLLPGYVAYFLGNADDPEAKPLPARLRTAGVVALVTSLGFFLVYAVLAGVAVAIGASALRNVSVLELVVGSLLVVLGLGMATGRFRPTVHVPLPERQRSAGGFFAFGVVYAAAAAGCTAPLFVAIAGVALGSTPLDALLIFGAYALGMSVLMLGVTVISALGRGAILRVLSRRIDLVTRVAGVLLVLAGLFQIYFFLFEFDGLALLGF